ncbi:unnamed protein product, partial [Polarella glacialis]
MTDMELPEMDDKKAAALYSRTDLLKAIAEFFSDALPRVGYVEDHFWTNIRIILCIVCCGCGVYAQFVLKFPQDRGMIGLCVLGYFAFTTLVALIDLFVMKAAVMCIKVNEKSVFVDVNLPAFSSELTLSLRTRTRTVDHKIDVGKYFDSEGYLCQETLYADF